MSSSLQVVNFNEVQNIIKYRCGTCHAKNPTFEGIEVAPKGVTFMILLMISSKTLN